MTLLALVLGAAVVVALGRAVADRPLTEASGGVYDQGIHLPEGEPVPKHSRRRQIRTKLFIIAMITLVAAGILAAVAGGILIAYDQ